MRSQMTSTATDHVLSNLEICILYVRARKHFIKKLVAFSRYSNASALSVTDGRTLAAIACQWKDSTVYSIHYARF